jgi:phage virion morphogenesis protein
MAFATLEAELTALIAKLDASSRRKLAREIAKQVRASQQARIRAQQNPDGSAYAPRKSQFRQKKGELRRQMFNKLRSVQWLKAEATTDAAVVGFVGQVSRLATVHQYGLRDRVSSKGPDVQYEKRGLLGFTQLDIDGISDMIIRSMESS